MPVRLSESDVTIAVVRHLGRLGWRIVSMALPGGGSGIAFGPADAKLRGVSNGAIIPDIVGQHPRGDYLMIESKPRPNVADAIKLRKLYEDEYKDSVTRVLGADCVLHLGAAFGPRSSRDMATAREVNQLLAVGFEIGADGDVAIAWDNSGLLLDR